MIHGNYAITTRRDNDNWIATITRTDGREFTTFPEHDKPFASVDTMRFYSEGGAIEEAKKAIDGGGMRPVK